MSYPLGCWFFPLNGWVYFLILYIEFFGYFIFNSKVSIFMFVLISLSNLFCSCIVFLILFCFLSVFSYSSLSSSKRIILNPKLFGALLAALVLSYLTGFSHPWFFTLISVNLSNGVTLHILQICLAGTVFYQSVFLLLDVSAVNVSEQVGSAFQVYLGWDNPLNLRMGLEYPWLGT